MKIIIKSGRKAPPTRKPEWAFFMAGWCFALTYFVWMVPVWLTKLPVVGTFLLKEAWWTYARFIVPGIVAFFMLRTGFRLVCRGAQICFPEELEAYQSEKEMSV